ncbi:MAG: amidohydrolase [Clostridiaceae bacterium]|nr:amidohydrolase [Clostridiaceae bacterium]
MYGKIANEWIEKNRDYFMGMSDKIWDFAEIGLKEFKSSKLIMDALEKEGFSIEAGIAGMPTAFKATWGSGKPVIGLLGEYDALISSSQKRGVANQEPIVQGRPGHACGHNLFGVGMMAAAIGLKKEMENDKLQGTIVYLGCPAEEFLLGKVYMAKEGAFDGLDIALTWHPDTVNYPDESIFQAMYNIKFNFYGISAHASESPEQGRSALDAVELMNVGVNYLREHMVSTARIHYSITNGGGPPNTVPDYAQVWYFVRGPEKDTAEMLFNRVKKIAEGAAMMTETRVEVKFITACHENLPNDVVLQALYDAITATPPQQWDEEDHKLAEGLIKTHDPISYKATLERLKNTAGMDSKEEEYLYNRAMPLTHQHQHLPLGSSDFGDVTWIVPAAQAYIACCPVNTPYHSWQWAVAAGSGIGKKGMIYAAKVFAAACLDFIHHPEKVEAAQEEFRVRTGGKEFRSLLEPGSKIPFDEF